MKRLFLLLPLVLILASFLPPVARSQAAGAREVRYTVDLTRAGEGELEITLEMEAASRPLVLEMPDTYGNGLASGLASHIEQERASDTSGQALPVSRDGNTWSIDHQGGLTFTYEVRMEGYAADTAFLDSLAGSGAPWPFFPILDPDLAYLPGYAVFVSPQGSQYIPSLQLEMPARWRHALPWSEQPSSMDELLNNPVCAGELSLQEEGSLLIAVPEASPAASGNSLAEYGGKARVLLEKAESLLGGLGLEEGHRLTLLLLFRGEEGTAGDLYYPSSPFSGSVVVSASTQQDPLSDAAIAATARGMSSLLLERELHVDGEASWLREGASWYLQDLLPYETGLWGSGLFWDRFNFTYNTYRESRAGSTASIAQAGESGYQSEDAAVLLTCGGASACASIDSELRSLQPYSLDISTFLRNLYVMGSPEAPLSNADILAALAGVTGREWSAFFRDYIEGTEEIPASAFSSLNILEPGGSSLPIAEPETDTSASDWILLGVAMLVVFIIPFILEPYTMRPRKPGFLERELAKDDED